MIAVTRSVNLPDIHDQVSDMNAIIQRKRSCKITRLRAHSVAYGQSKAQREPAFDSPKSSHPWEVLATFVSLKACASMLNRGTSNPQPFSAKQPTHNPQTTMSLVCLARFTLKVSHSKRVSLNMALDPRKPTPFTTEVTTTIATRVEDKVLNETHAHPPSSQSHI